MAVVSEASRAVLRALSGAIGALAAARALGAPLLPLTGALEQLSEAQRHLLDPSAPPPFLAEYVEREAVKKRRMPQRVWREDSAWDPDPLEQKLQTSSCKALLLEVIRRAINDWILYRTHDELQKKQIAQHAYIWLFQEGPGHPWWRRRHKKDGQLLTSFLNICELLDLDPEHVRRRAREMTPKEILTAGRPAENRRRTTGEPSVTEHEVVEDVHIEKLDESGDKFATSYEAQFAVVTPGYL